MGKIYRVFSIFLITIMIFAASGCTNKNKMETNIPKEQKQVTLTVSAAASLRDSMEEIKKLYSQEKTNVKLNIIYGASGTLQHQIEQGAGTDVFVSATVKQMNALSQEKLILEDTKVNLLRNAVVLIVKKDNSSGINDFRDSATDKIKKIALGEPKTVPAGQYAEEVFTKLGILDKVKAKAVYGKDVKEVLTWVETGNADAGVVYATDAKASSKVKVAAAAAKDLYKTPVVYPAAVIKASKNVSEAKEFLKFISGAKGKAVFEKYGFDFLIK